MNIFKKSTAAYIPSASEASVPPQIEEIITCHQKKIYNLLLQLTLNADEAKDLTQETFIKAYLGLKKLRDPSKISSWLARIAVNSFRNRLRYNQRRGMPVTISLDALPEECAEMIEQLRIDGPESACREGGVTSRDGMLARVLLVEIHNLEPRYQIPFSLYIKNHTCEEIAAILKKRPGTVKSLIFRAREKIKQALKPWLENASSPTENATPTDRTKPQGEKFF